MSKDSLEHISSLMDGELSQETGLFVARRMGSDEELSKAWSRFHLVRECLRRPGGQLALAELTVDFENVSSVGKETVVPGRGAPAWLKPVSGFAIAASVAVVAILVAMPGSVEISTEDGPGAQPFTSPNPLTVAPPSQAASFNGSQQTRNARLNSYLLRHNQVAGSAGRQGFVSFVPIVTAAPVQITDPGETQPADSQVEADSGDSTQP